MKPQKEREMAEQEQATEQPSVRRVANAVRHLSSDRRCDLYSEHFGREAPRTATVGAVSTAVAHALLGKGIPEDVSVLLMPYKRREGGGGNGRRTGVKTVLRELLKAGEHVSFDTLKETCDARGIDIEGQKLFERKGAGGFFEVMLKRLRREGIVPEVAGGVAHLPNTKAETPKPEAKPDAPESDGAKTKPASKAKPKGKAKPKSTSKSKKRAAK